MKRIAPVLSETQVAALAMATLMMVFLGSGCVGLDKPPEVAKCSTGDQACVDGVQPDSGMSQGGRGGADGGLDLGGGGAAGGAPAMGGDAGISGMGGTGPGVQDAGGQGGASDASPGMGGASGGDASAIGGFDAGSTPDVPLDTAAGAVDVAGVPADATAGNGTDASAVDVALGGDVGGKEVSGADARPAVDLGVSSTATVTFSQGVASGPMTGYGWVTLGSADSVTSPTCGTGSPTITSINPCLKGTIWNSANALCVTGAVPALPAVPTATDYANNWGLQVGVNAKEPNGAMAKSFSTITINFSAAPVSDLRVELHRSGDVAGATYCYSGPISGVAIELGQFNTKCWDGTGTALTAADVPTLDSVGLQVTSGATPVTVTNLCLNSIVFGS